VAWRRWQRKRHGVACNRINKRKRRAAAPRFAWRQQQAASDCALCAAYASRLRVYRRIATANRGWQRGYGWRINWRRRLFAARQRSMATLRACLAPRAAAWCLSIRAKNGFNGASRHSNGSSVMARRGASGGACGMSRQSRAFRAKYAAHAAKSVSRRAAPWRAPARCVASRINAAMQENITNLLTMVRQQQTHREWLRISAYVYRKIIGVTVGVASSEENGEDRKERRWRRGVSASRNIMKRAA